MPFFILKKIPSGIILTVNVMSLGFSAKERLVSAFREVRASDRHILY